MKSYVDLYIGHLAAEDKSPDTLAQYQGQLNRLEKWLKKNCNTDLSNEGIHAVTGIMLTEFYQTLHMRNFAVSTRNRYVIAIKEFFEFLMGIGAVSKNPSAVLHCIKEKETPDSIQPHMYDTEQIKALLNSILSGASYRNRERDVAMVAMILATGLRASELCSLNGSQLPDIRSGFVVCKRKGGNWKRVEVGNFALHHLETYLFIRGEPAADDPIFLSRNGHRMTRNALWKSFATKQLHADIPTGIHILRHTVLSAIDHDGGSALARDVGGHSSVAVTNRYVHTTQEERKQAINGTAFAELFS